MENEIRVIESGSALATSKEVYNDAMLRDFIAFIDASERTVKTYAFGVRRFLSFLAARGITRPTRDDVVAYKDSLEAEGLKSGSRKIYIESVKLFSAWLSSRGLYPHIAEHVKIKDKKSTIHKKKALTPAQVDDILDRLEAQRESGKRSEQTRRDFAIFLLMLTSGLRTIEVIRANVDSLDNLGGETVLYVHGKGRDEADEVVIVDPIVERAIREYLDMRSEPIAETVELEDESGKKRTRVIVPLFTSTAYPNKGGRLTTRTISGMVKKYLVKIGLGKDEKLSAHSLRHTMITEFIKRGGSLHEAQQAARHKRPETTQVYIDELDIISNKCSKTVAAALLGKRYSTANNAQTSNAI